MSIVLNGKPWKSAAVDFARLRHDFPALDQKIHGKPLIYLDNAATTQKPRAVLDALQRYYADDNANVHRGVHDLSQRATRDFEAARHKVQQFLNASKVEEIVFTRGTTEAINLVAHSFGQARVGPGDEIVISHMEHHSNIVPWQMLCEAKGATLRVVPIDDRGQLVFAEYEKLLNDRTKLVAVVHVSNSLGTINPAKRIIDAAHRRHIPVFLDGAQAVAHMPVDVQALNCDFYAFSGHKLYGPTGIGVLYGKYDLLDALPPYQGGGDMIRSVTFAKTTYADPPSKFEAGTPNIAGAVGLGAAIDYVQAIGLDALRDHDARLTRYATEKLKAIRGVRLIGTADEKVGAVSFVVEDLSTLDVGTRLDLEGIAVRTGHHCCQPVMDRYGIPASARASFALYNTTAEIDTFVAALQRIVATARGKTVAVKDASREIVYPKTIAASPHAAADTMAEAFDLLGDWAARYEYLMGLGKKLAPLPDTLRTEANRVRGCQSTVYLAARARPGTTDIIEFLADSDADLVRGLIALLQRVFSGQKADDILAFDVEGFFARLGLDQHLTLGRRNGLAAMVQRLLCLAHVLTAVRDGRPAPV